MTENKFKINNGIDGKKRRTMSWKATGEKTNKQAQSFAFNTHR